MPSGSSAPCWRDCTGPTSQSHIRGSLWSHRRSERNTRQSQTLLKLLGDADMSHSLIHSVEVLQNNHAIKKPILLFIPRTQFQYVLASKSPKNNGNGENNNGNNHHASENSSLARSQKSESGFVRSLKETSDFAELFTAGRCLFKTFWLCVHAQIMAPFFQSASCSTERVKPTDLHTSLQEEDYIPGFKREWNAMGAALENFYFPS